MNKTYKATLRKAEQGELEAVFAFTGGEPDLDNDITLPGAFDWKRQECVLEPWNHNYGELPVGKGTIVEEADGRVVFKGRVFTQTTSGRDHWHALKELGPLAQWSYSFQILSSRPGKHRGQPVRYLEKLAVSGVGPVTRAAQPASYTASVKSRRGTRALLAEIDALHTRLLDMQLDATERRVKAQLAKSQTSRLEAYRQSLIDDGMSEALAHEWGGSMIASEVAPLLAQYPMLERMSPGWARREVLRHWLSPVE